MNDVVTTPEVNTGDMVNRLLNAFITDLTKAVMVQVRVEIADLTNERLGELEQKMEAMENDLEYKVQEAVENFDFEDAVREAVSNLDFEVSVR